MLKVKAVWKVGYPSGEDKNIYTKDISFECDDNWGRKKAEEGKVKIVAELEDIIDITKVRTKDDLSFIAQCRDEKKIEKWIDDESKRESRKTILSLLEERLLELKEACK